MPKEKYITCPTCNGEGVVEKNIQRDGEPERDVPVECPHCEGSGRILDEQIPCENKEE